MFGLGPLELGMLAALTVFVFGWQALPKLFRQLQRFQNFKGNFAEELRKFFKIF